MPTWLRFLWVLVTRVILVFGVIFLIVYGLWAFLYWLLIA
jgi:hypothetical protein